LKQNFRIGSGYDVHAFESERPLVLGGVHIPFDRGLKGHSDADALLHSVCDALLGALALGDIGKHFPDTDPKYKNIDSKILLKQTYGLIKDHGYEICNLDSTIVIERPKMAPYIDMMRKTIAELLGCGVEQVSVKATTSEKMGFVGLEEGAKVFATVLLQKSEA
jgi:2-C-methyl-D-erythritol 2,4-cyclodiphosphate synthase